MYSGLRQAFEGQRTDNLSKPMIRVFQETLREIIRKHFDFEKAYKEQQENLAKCEQEVLGMIRRDWIVTFAVLVLTSNNNDHRRA